MSKVSKEKKSITTKEIRVIDFLKKEGYPNTKIGSLIGYSEATVRRNSTTS